MYRLLVVCSLALGSLSLPQQRRLFNGDPATAAILAETRNVRLDGSADVAYAQEDGVLFKETTSDDGERRGSYEFVGDDGELYRVEYTAGKGGFKVISSTHVDATPDLPTGPAQYYEPAPVPAPVPARQPVRQPAPLPAPEPVSNTFEIRYNPSRHADPVTFPTTTTTQRTVRKNYHTGDVKVAQDGQGYVYSYTHTG